MTTADAALSNTNVDLLTAPCLNIAVNLVVRFENDSPVVNSEIFLFIRFEMRAGLSPGKNKLRHRTSEHMRRMPCSITDGFAAPGTLTVTGLFGCIAVLFAVLLITDVLLNDKAGITYRKGCTNKGIRARPA